MANFYLNELKTYLKGAGTNSHKSLNFKCPYIRPRNTYAFCFRHNERYLHCLSSYRKQSDLCFCCMNEKKMNVEVEHAQKRQVGVIKKERKGGHK